MGNQILDDGTLVVIWDNLFYELVTQKNPSFRDLLIDVLIFNHSQQLWLNTNIESTTKATVVIPKSFFGLSENNEQQTSKRFLEQEFDVKLLPESEKLLTNTVLQENANKLVSSIFTATENVQRLEKRYRKSENRS